MGFPIFSSLAQHQIPMQNAKIYRVWLPSVIYSQHSTTLSYFGYSAAFTISGPLAQLAERGADNAKVVSSTLTRTKEKFFFYLNFFFAQSHSLTSWSVFIYIKNHLVYKHERRHCFVTSKYNDLYERSFLKTISFMKKVSSIKMIIISEKKKIVSVTSAIG